MKAKLQVLDQQNGSTSKDGSQYICVSDIARYKKPDRTTIEQGMTQFERLVKLSALAIGPMRVLLERESSPLPLLPGEGG